MSNHEDTAVLVRRNERIPVAGGELAADVYLRRDASPGPALITLVPYSKDAIAGVGAWEANHYFAEHGYAAVVVDMRGLGCSTGHMRHPFDPTEADDGLAAIAWAAAQPWCDGMVGMWGVSYGAMTTLRTASRRPKKLRAIIPILGCLDPERDFIHPNGRHGFLASLGVWALTMFSVQCLPPLDFDGDRDSLWRTRIAAEPHLFDLLRHPPGHPIWRERAIDAGSIDTPTFCVAGQRDLFCDGSIRAFEAIQAPKKLLFGPWMHTVPQEAPQEPVDLLPQMLEWWERWLRPDSHVDEQADQAVATVFFGGGCGWRKRRGSWCADRSTVLYPTSNGQLANAPSNEAAIKYGGDPLFGVAAGLWAFPSGGQRVPGDQTAGGEGAITFTTEILEDDLNICGRPSLTLGAEREAVKGVSARLSDVGPDGCATLISVGASDPAHTKATIGFSPTAHVVRAGHRLRLLLATAEFPRVRPEEPRELTFVGGDRTFLSLPTLEQLPDVADVARAKAGANPLVVAGESIYEVRENGAAVRVEVGDRGTMWTIARGTLIESEGSATAYAEPTRPGEAAIAARRTFHIDDGSERIDIALSFTVCAHAADASTAIMVNGREYERREWSIADGAPPVTRSPQREQALADGDELI